MAPRSRTRSRSRSPRQTWTHITEVAVGHYVKQTLDKIPHRSKVPWYLTAPGEGAGLGRGAQVSDGLGRGAVFGPVAAVHAQRPRIYPHSQFLKYQFEIFCFVMLALQ